MTEEPAITDRFPELLREKSNPGSTVSQALATELGVQLLLNAFAFTMAVFVTVNGAAYMGEDCVGSVPSVV